MEDFVSCNGDEDNDVDEWENYDRFSNFSPLPSFLEGNSDDEIESEYMSNETGSDTVYFKI